MGEKSEYLFAPSNKLTESRFNSIFDVNPSDCCLDALEPYFPSIAVQAGVSIADVKEWVRGRCMDLYGGCP